MKNHVMKGYMCSVDFETELSADNPARVYPTLKDIKRGKSCVHKGSEVKSLHCGIYEVEITVKLKRVVQKAGF